MGRALPAIRVINVTIGGPSPPCRIASGSRRKGACDESDSRAIIRLVGRVDLGYIVVDSRGATVLVTNAAGTGSKVSLVYLVQHTHTDIGYTRPQTEILPEHLRYIDYALDYCDLTDGYPDDARFRWTCETSWAVREYLQGAARPNRSSGSRSAWRKAASRSAACC